MTLVLSLPLFPSLSLSLTLRRFSNANSGFCPQFLFVVGVRPNMSTLFPFLFFSDLERGSSLGFSWQALEESETVFSLLPKRCGSPPAPFYPVLSPRMQQGATRHKRISKKNGSLSLSLFPLLCCKCPSEHPDFQRSKKRHLSFRPKRKTCVFLFFPSPCPSRWTPRRYFLTNRAEDIISLFSSPSPPFSSAL